jgi:hypothetical protein
VFVTYKPEDGDRQRWSFDPTKVRASKAEAIEQAAGLPWDQWLGAVQTGAMRARRALLWHLLTVDHPGLKFEDTPDFYAGELVLEYSATELSGIRDRLAKVKLPADQRAATDAAIDMALADLAERGQEPEGKAR